MPKLRCEPVITDDPMPEPGDRCMIYEDGKGTAWFLVNRAALHADPEGVFKEMVGHCDASARAYDRELIQSLAS